MDSSAATVAPAELGRDGGRFILDRTTVLWALGAVTALGVAIRFASLGVQSYHHDEVITVARVIPGSFGHMLHEVRVSESNPPLYYVLAWGWAKLFGSGEVGMRSLSALLGAATIPVAYLTGRELASSRAGLIAAAIVSVNPMLVWYSQEARSYALLVFFGALALLFFARALRTRSARDLALWALASALALCSHYFAMFPAAIEGAWLLVALRDRRREALAAIGSVVAVGLALTPLIVVQSNGTHIGWIDRSPLSSRLFETGVSFLAGETGHVIAEPPREYYALIPATLIGAGLLFALYGSRRERRGVGLGLTVGLGVALLAGTAAAVGKDYVVERNLLPALIPLAIAVAVGFSAGSMRRVGAVCAILLCAYWLAFDVYVDRTPNLQRPDFRDLVAHLGAPRRPRAIVTWKLAANPILYYLHDAAVRDRRGVLPVREIDVISKPVVGARSPRLPSDFHRVARLRLERLTLTRYMSRRLHLVRLSALRDARTGFGSNAVVSDGDALSSAALR